MIFKILGIISAIAFAICMFVFFIEVASSGPYYVYEQAIVRKVIDDCYWGYIGEDYRTLIRFDDGFTTHISGNRGEPGDRILAPRKRGTKTPFGILGDVSYWEAKRNVKP